MKLSLAEPDGARHLGYQVSVVDEAHDLGEQRINRRFPEAFGRYRFECRRNVIDAVQPIDEALDVGGGPEVGEVDALVAQRFGGHTEHARPRPGREADSRVARAGCVVGEERAGVGSCYEQ